LQSSHSDTAGPDFDYWADHWRTTPILFNSLSTKSKASSSFLISKIQTVYWYIQGNIY
jgi:hypothetical protein